MGSFLIGLCDSIEYFRSYGTRLLEKFSSRPLSGLKYPEVRLVRTLFSSSVATSFDVI